MKALILTGRGVQDVEFVYPFYRLQEAGYRVDVAVRGKLQCSGIIGIKIEPTRDIPDVREATGYDVLVLPGGVKAMEHLRLDEGILAFVHAYYAAGGLIGSICSGAQLLISARICKGNVISAYPAMRVDVENAGAKFHHGPVVVSDRIVSAPHYRDLGPWMKALLEEAGRVQGFRRTAACAAAL